MEGKTVAIIAVIFIIYLLFGALMFHLIESPHEEDVIEEARQAQEELIANLTQMNITGEQIQQFVQAVMKVSQYFPNVTGTATDQTNWDFSSAFFFSGTVVTTIGYGNSAPSTRTGRNFCIVYALIGIPLCGFLLTGIGEKLGLLAKKLEGLFYDRVTCGYPTILRLTYIAILLVIGGIFFITIPSVIFKHVEGWNLSESWYYCFITLTTIGFGDYVIGTRPGEEYSAIYQWACYVWIIVGMSFLALIISLLSDLMTDYAGRIKEEQKRRRKQLKNLTDKQLTRLGSSEKKNKGETDAEANENGERVKEEEDDVETPLDATDKP
ncbi:Potassium channel subfamily K member 10 [Holothuria leucospilota]|uniref:Potassium channel subfamily K member 10 n=1 Tax=Holothuria leucospilota TaxID=206669 RepID=A0A9Q1CIF6_HOLLE|nr:Potassium channel subfamily K member 10 [Holothuria leucospilota]